MDETGGGNDLALRIELDASSALATTRELHQELKAIEVESQAVAASAQQRVDAVASSATAVNDSVTVSASEATASLSGVDAALEQTKATAEETGSWIAEHPVLTLQLVNAGMKAAGAGSLMGAAWAAGSSLATAAMTTLAASALATTVVVTGSVAAFVLLGQVIPTGRIDELAESLQVARSETDLLRGATTQLAEAQRQGVSGDVFNAALKAEDTQRGRSDPMPEVDLSKAALAEAIGGQSGDGVSIKEAVKLAGKISYEIDVPTLEATAKEARRSVQTIADDLAKVSASTSGAGWGEISTLSAIANLSDDSVKSLGVSVEELRIRAVTNADAFASLGINVLTAEGGLQSSAAVARQFADALDSMSDSERKAALESLSLSEGTQAVVNDMAKQATAISESRDAITAQNELTAAQERARIGNQLSSLTTMAEAVGSRFKNWSDATIEAVSRPIMKAGADLTEWAAGGAATALQTLDGWLAAIESKVTGVDAAKLRLLDVTDGSDGAKGTDEPTAAKLDIATPATHLDWLRQEVELREKLRDLQADDKGKKPEKSEADKELDRQLATAEKFREALYEVQRQIDDVGLSKPDQRKNELMAGGADAATAGQTSAAEARLRTEQRLTDAMRERDRVAMSAAERTAAEVRDDGGSAERAAQIAAIVAETQAKTTLLAIEKELAQLNMSAGAKAADDAKRGGATEADQAEIAAETSRLAVEKELQDIEEQRRKLATDQAVKQQFAGESDAVQREALASRERMDRLRKETSDTETLAKAQRESDELLNQTRAAADRDRAKQLTEQYADPTEKLRQQREELDRLHADGLVGADAYARGVAGIQKKFDDANGSAKALRDTVNTGISAYSTAAIDAVMRGIGAGDVGLNGNLAATPFPAALPTVNPLAPPAANALTLPPVVPMKDAESETQLKAIADLLAQALGKLDGVKDATEDTTAAVNRLIDEAETL